METLTPTDRKREKVRGGGDSQSYPIFKLPQKFNMADYFLDRHVREGKGDNPAVYFQDVVFTYKDIQQSANSLAQSLLGLGLSREDRIGVWLRDCPEFVVSCFGIWKIGACFIPIDERLSEETIEYIFDIANFHCLVVSPNQVEYASNLITNKSSKISSPSCKLVVVRGTQMGEKYGKNNEKNGKQGKNGKQNMEIYSFEQLTTKKNNLENICVETDRDDVAFWGWTSGTTGLPKAAVHLHHDFAYNYYILKDIFPINSKDCTMTSSKLTFVLAQGINLLFPFAEGASVVLFEEFVDEKQLLDHLVKYKPSVFTGLPRVYSKMLSHFQSNGTEEMKDALHHVRYFLCAGEPLSIQLQRSWKDELGKEIHNCIGSTETCHWYIANKPGDVKEGSIGKVLPGVQTRIVSEEGKDVKVDEPGVLWVRTDSLAPIYWRNNEATQKTMLGNDWYTTGDRVKQDKDGYIWYLGREKDTFKFAATFISPAEMAHAVEQNSGDIIKECWVLLVSIDGNDKPIAFVICKEGITKSDKTKEDILNRITDHTWSGLKLVPYDVVFVDHYPTNDRHKVDAEKLKAMYNPSSPPTA